VKRVSLLDDHELAPFSTLYHSFNLVMVVASEEKQAQISVRKWN